MQPTATTACSFHGEVEFAEHFTPRSSIAHVLFDFDGTLSILREGWPDVMVPMFAEMLPLRSGEAEADVHRLLFDDIMRLNGKQTIYQMMQFADRVRERGGQARDPLWYKREYLRRLDERIAGRVAALREGASPERYLVNGARKLLESLQARGMTLYLASGTDEEYVQEEAALLRVERFFGAHIYGALDDYKQFSKKMVIDRILEENRVSGDELLAFGDGYVEIQNTKEVGGLAVAVASDEANNGSGRMDPWKRQRLRSESGADAIIPDYRDAHALLACLFGESPIPASKG